MKWGKEQSGFWGNEKNVKLLSCVGSFWPCIANSSACRCILWVRCSSKSCNAWLTGEASCIWIQDIISCRKKLWAYRERGISIVFAVKMHHYLFGHKFTMITDWGYFQESGLLEKSAAHILHWALLLSVYSYHLEYRPGKLHANADGLSRLPLKAK